MSAPKGSIIITGANGGLGCGMVSGILLTPELSAYHGIYTVRDASSAPALHSILKRSPATAHSHEVVSLELSRLTSVREIASAINARVASGEIPPIRALVLNAGLNDIGQQEFTEDGFDMSFVSTYLGHWLLTMLLLQSMDQKSGRVVVLGSNSCNVNHSIQKLGGTYVKEKWKIFIQGDSIDGIAKGTWSSNKDDVPSKAGIRRYGAAKLCCVMMISELQQRLDSDPALSAISVVGVDPGVMGTRVGRRGGWFLDTVIFGAVFPMLAWVSSWTSNPAPTFRTVDRSAEDVLSAAFDQDEPRLRGKLLDGHVVQDVVPEAADLAKREMVWRDSVKYAKLTGQDTALARWK